VTPASILAVFEDLPTPLSEVGASREDFFATGGKSSSTADANSLLLAPTVHG